MYQILHRVKKLKIIFHVCAFSYLVNICGGFQYSNTTQMDFFRFRDFEPRSSRELSQDSQMRKSRGFHFHADTDDLIVDLELVVPFVKIPVKKSKNVSYSLLNKLANLNTASLVWTGAIVAVGASVMGIYKVFSSTLNLDGGYSKNSRAVEAFSHFIDPLMGSDLFSNATQTQARLSHGDNIMHLMQSKLLENDFDLSFCVQKVICSYVQQTATNVLSGKASNFNKIIDGLFSLDVTQNYLSGTAVQHALNTGRSGRNCDNVYFKCKWSHPENQIAKFLTKLINPFGSL